MRARKQSCSAEHSEVVVKVVKRKKLHNHFTLIIRLGLRSLIEQLLPCLPSSHLKDWANLRELNSARQKLLYQFSRCQDIRAQHLLWCCSDLKVLSCYDSENPFSVYFDMDKSSRAFHSGQKQKHFTTIFIILKKLFIKMKIKD